MTALVAGLPGAAWAKASGPDAGYAGDPPNSKNCTGCHNADIVKDGNGSAPLSTLSPVQLSLPAHYVAGRQLSFTVSISSPQSLTNGFEVVPKIGNNISGTLSAADANTQVKTGYAMHTLVGNRLTSWTLKWTPPGAGAGTVTFYAAGNASNGDSKADTGDRISLTTATITENLKPGAPSLASPADGGLATSAPPTLSVGAAADGNGDALQYRFQLCADAACASALETSALQSATSWQPGASLTENAMYYWRAQANDGYEDGAYSSVFAFYFDAVTEPPGAVAFVTPVSESTLEPGAATFVVSAAADPDPGDVPVYDFILATDAAFSTVVDFASGVTAVSGQAAWSPGTALVEGTTYYLLAQARDTQGNLGPAAVTRFLAHRNDPPVAPAVNAPADATVVNVAAVALSASLAADPQGDVLTYRFQVCADAGCAAVLENSPEIATAPAAATVTWTTSPLSENGRFYWRARAWDGYVFGPYMTAASFYVDAVSEPPAAPVLVAPFIEGFSFGTSTPTLVVSNGDDPDPLAAPPVYDVTVYDDAGRTNAVASAAGLRDAGATTSWIVAPALTDLATYYLTVTARDADGNTAVTTATFFVDTANTAPGVPLNPTPNGGVVTVAAPLLSASPATDAEGDTLTYYFSLDTAPTFTGAQAQFSGALTWPSWTPSPLADRVYFWRVVAFDGGYYGAPADATVAVNAVNEPPGAPTPVTPLDGAQVNSRFPTLQSGIATDPEGDPLVYVFEIAADAGFASILQTAAPVAPAAGAVAWTPPLALADNATYYWRVRARDAADASVVGPNSAVFSVTVVNGNLPPMAPGAKDATQAADEPVSLLATGATDPDGDAVTLTYEIYLDSTLSTLADAAFEHPADAPFKSTAVDYTRGTYYWRVKANDGVLDGPWSRTAKLTLTIDPLPFETGADLPAERQTGVRVREEASGGCRTSPASLALWLLAPLLLLRRRRILAAGTLFLLACGDGETKRIEEPVIEPATYGLAEAQAIFNEHCIGCHSGEEPAAGLELDEEHAPKSLIGVTPANEIAADRGMKRVDMGHPENSFLLYKVSEPGLGEGERMPLKLPKLSDEEIETLRRWIAGS